MIQSEPKIFDRSLYRRRRARASASFGTADFLHRRALEDVIDRLETVTRSFPLAGFYGAAGLVPMLTAGCAIGEAFCFDFAPERLAGSGAAFDEEVSALAPQAFDLIVSVLTLHATNDLVGALVQARLALKPDGLFLGVLFAEDTLSEVRAALHHAEAAILGGVSARVAPFASVRDLGAAMQRAGFTLPVVDVDRVRVDYSDPSRVFADLRAMGETSVLDGGSASRRRRGLRRDVLRQAVAMLAANGGTISFDLATLTGWAPAAARLGPPGSATG